MSRFWALCSECGVENNPDEHAPDGLLLFTCYYCDSGQQISPDEATRGQGFGEPWPLSARTSCCDVLTRVLPGTRGAVLSLVCPQCSRPELIAEHDATHGGQSRPAALAGRCPECRSITALLPPRWRSSHLTFDCSRCRAPLTISRSGAEAHGEAALDDLRLPPSDSATPPVIPMPAPPFDSELDEPPVKVYRVLVKRFHPDLSQDPAEVHRREELIKNINRAWTDGDFATLRRLEQQSR